MKMKKTSTGEKMVYTPPKISTTSIHVEYSIAAGSATVTPVSSTNDVREEWEDGTNVAGQQTW
ncbi:hypothetical protein [Sphingobacterium chungjuense]|uniref:hypothetical protein n=1 Tax=Sphingobacterium chungjuense TaxID=2675553 RepID=UPI0019D0F719|nr:hypothetical protein [Sphingobacterium chungjuense]